MDDKHNSTTQSTPHAPSAINSLPSRSSDPQTLGQSTMSDTLPYVVGGVVLAFIVIAVLVAVFLWRRRPATISSEEHSLSESKEKRSRIYNEICEIQEKKRGLKQHQEDEAQALAVDSAPDIIAAHDGESIYETIDGRRSLRYKAATLVTPLAAGAVSPSGTDSPLNRTYDHLEHFQVNRSNNARAPVSDAGSLPPMAGHLGRALPPVERGNGRGSARSSSSSSSSNSSNRGRVDMTPSHNRRSSLADLSASQGSPGGRRIVCQLTMVGVVENGRPVPLPIQQTATSNAYFVLEPRGDTDSLSSDEPAGFPFAPNAKFRIREEREQAEAGERAADYFILEPLGQQQELSDMMGDRQTHADQKEALEHDLLPRDSGRRCSLHGHNSISSFRDSADSQSGQQQQQQKKFRDTRIRSCPDDDGAEVDLPLPDRATSIMSRDFRRSFSSPNPNQHATVRRNSSVTSTRDIKLDPAFLQTRIQQELIAMGLVPAAPRQPSHGRNVSKKLQPPKPQPSSDERSGNQRNEYFILEPDAALSESDEDTSGFAPVAPVFHAASQRRAGNRWKTTRSFPEDADQRGKESRYHRQHSHAVPPRLPKRNQGEASHKRSRSETPLLTSLGSAQPPPAGAECDQGPVIVSLKKSKSTEEKGVQGPGILEGAAPDSKDALSPQGSFRPRIKSAPSEASADTVTEI